MSEIVIEYSPETIINKLINDLKAQGLIKDITDIEIIREGERIRIRIKRPRQMSNLSTLKGKMTRQLAKMEVVEDGG